MRGRVLAGEAPHVHLHGAAAGSHEQAGGRTFSSTLGTASSACVAAGRKARQPARSLVTPLLTPVGCGAVHDAPTGAARGPMSWI